MSKMDEGVKVFGVEYDQGFMCKTPAEADKRSRLMPSFEEILDMEDEARQLDEVRLYFKNLGANSSNDIDWAFYGLVEAYLEHLKGYRRKYGA